MFGADLAARSEGCDRFGNMERVTFPRVIHGGSQAQPSSFGMGTLICWHCDACFEAERHPILDGKSPP